MPAVANRLVSRETSKVSHDALQNLAWAVMAQTQTLPITGPPPALRRSDNRPAQHQGGRRAR